MDKHIKDVLGSFVKKNGYEGSVFSQRLMDHWAERMSTTIVQQTRSIDYERGIVTMRFESAALRHEMFTLRDRIKIVFSEAFPDIRISEVIVR